MLITGDSTNEYTDLVDTLNYLEEGLNEETSIETFADLTTGTYNWSTGTKGAITIPTGNTVTINLSGTVTVTGKITISQNSILTIKGTGTLKRGSGYLTPILDVYDTGTLIIEGNSATNRIIIDGNKSLGQDGESTLIRSDQNLTLKYVTLQNNTTERYRDTEDEEDLTVNSEDTHAGGAITILNRDSVVNIDNCIIKNCQAVNGGGIYFCRLGYGDINISNTTISGCTATSGGGGIYIDGKPKTGETVAIENIANYSMNMNNVIIEGCEATQGSAIFMANSGSSNIVMNDCIIRNCTSSNTGSAGTVRTDGNGNYKFTMSGGEIYGNYSACHGSGIYWNASGTNSLLIVKDKVKIYNNESVKQGGGLFVEGKNMQIQSANIYNNKAALGGGIGIKTFANSSYTDGNWSATDSFNLILSEDVNISNNVATEKGGGLAFNIVDGVPANGFTFNYINQGAIFENNIVSSDNGTTISGVGGAIAIVEATSVNTYNVNTIIEYGTFKNNKAEEGGAIHSTIGDFTMNGGTIENHNVSGNGGAVYISGGEFELSGTAQIRECSSSNGGGIFISGGNVKVNGGEIVNCQAKNGGGIYISNGDMTMNGGAISNNQATEYGGGIYASSDSQNLNVTISSGSIIGNIANKNGGGLGINIGDGYAANITVGLESCKGLDELHSHPIIQDNTANENGGGFWLNGDNMTMNMYCGFIEKNIAILEPGSSNIYQTGGQATVYGGTVGEGVIVIGGKYDYIPENDIPEVYITYNSNIEGNIETKKAQVTVGVEIYLPKNLFTRQGYVLVGWAYVEKPTVDDVIYEAGEPYLVTDEDVTVYAVWLLEGAGEIKTPVIKSGKHYDEITGETNIMVSSDADFTVQMIVNQIKPNLYKERTISFDKSLSNGTTILMIDVTNTNERKYYYYEVIGNEIKNILLSEFSEMSEGEKYADSDIETEVNEAFLFIVDLPNDNTIIGPTQITLTRYSNNSEIASIEQKVSYTTTEKRKFNLKYNNLLEDGTKATINDKITVSYEKSNPSGDDSRFVNRNMSLVISAIEGEAFLEEIQIYDGTNYYKINTEGKFVIPLGEVTEDKDCTIQIVSNVLVENRLSCDIKAELWVSANEDSENPFMGDKVATIDGISIENVKLPSLRIEMDKRVYHLNSFKGNIQLDYFIDEIDGCNMTLEIQKKNENNIYETQKGILTSVNEITINENGVFEFEIDESGKINLKIADTLNMESGTYRVLMKVIKNDEIILEIPYNFIILE